MRLIDADKIRDRINERYKCCNPGSIVEACLGAMLDIIDTEPTVTPTPDAPLTLEELREMGGEPVYTDGVYYILDCLEDDIGTNRTLIHMTDGTAFEWSVSKGMYPIIYRRKPEDGTL